MSTADAVLAGWLADGAIDAAQYARLKDVRWFVTDLPGELLGLAVDNAVYMDSTAAAHGWFVDAAGRSGAFGSDGVALDGSVAQDRFDLTTAVAHELGRLLGLEHGSVAWMQPSLATGVRLVAPTLATADAESATTAAGAGTLAPARAVAAALDRGSAVTTERASSDRRETRTPWSGRSAEPVHATYAVVLRAARREPDGGAERDLRVPRDEVVERAVAPTDASTEQPAADGGSAPRHFGARHLPLGRVTFLAASFDLPTDFAAHLTRPL